jgi:hypothetical protein
MTNEEKKRLSAVLRATEYLFLENIALKLVRCDACGDDFVIYHSPACVDKSVVDRQAYWLEEVLAEEHERDKKHPDRIELSD